MAEDNPRVPSASRLKLVAGFVVLLFVATAFFTILAYWGTGPFVNGVWGYGAFIIIGMVIIALPMLLYRIIRYPK